MKLSLLIFSFWYFSVTSQTYNYYFGNLHSHTAFSDGNKDSATSGVGRPDGSYAYAKLSQNFDFLGISEHNHYSSNHNPGFKLSRYQAGLNMADAANQDGTFLSLFGMEYGIASGNNGHVIIYGFNQLIGWETNVGSTTGNNYDIYNAKNDYDGLFRKIKNNLSSFAYLAHPYWTDFAQNGGDDSTALAFSAYNAMYDSAIVGVPLRSGHAFSTFADYSDYATGDYFSYFKKMLYNGYHIGIGYDHDNHYTNFGRSNGGRLVILAPTLTRQNLYSAMQQMHFYGSDDPNAKVEFTMNGNIMGSILTGSTYPTFNVIHNDPDGEQADTLRIWRGSKNSGWLWAEILQTTLKNNTATFTDYSLETNREYYYFVDIKQADGQWIVTSPIWYKATSPVVIKENSKEINFNYFPNPVSQQLNISVAEDEDYSISISDVSGREIYRNDFKASAVSIDLSGFSGGVYSLKVITANGFAMKRLIIE